MFFSVHPPTPPPSGDTGPVPPSSYALDVDLILLLVAVVIIAWALGQLSLLIFKAVRAGHRRRQEKLTHDETDEFS